MDQLVTQVLDPGWLSEQVGRPVRAARLRAKPQTSLVVGLDGPGGGSRCGGGRLAIAVVDGDRRVGLHRLRCVALRRGVRRGRGTRFGAAGRVLGGAGTAGALARRRRGWGLGRHDPWARRQDDSRFLRGLGGVGENHAGDHEQEPRCHDDDRGGNDTATAETM